MIKCFLSHSSKDKEHYVRKVADLIRGEVRIYDEETFEAGMANSEEIVNGLDEASLFVIFISNSALESEWVRSELDGAELRVELGKIDRIYPIIIDSDIMFDDPRIPKWMTNGINIQHISKPTVAARKINSRLREIAWKVHPALRERERIFVGRNEATSQVERRFDDFSKRSPKVFVASGLSSIGRKSFIRYSLKKATIVRDSYELPVIVLDANESIEDFILKIADLGLSQGVEIEGLLTKSIAEKHAIAVRLSQDIVSERERILIEDQGAIILFNGTVVDWFTNIIEELANADRLVFCIASRFRPDSKIMYSNESYYFQEIAELDRSERNGLLVRYADFNGVELSEEDFSFFSDILTGYPEQVIFTVDLIKDTSVFEARKNSHHIQEYASDKAKVIIENLKDDQVELELLYFLSKFDFISFEFLFSLVDEKTYFKIIDQFFLSSICERLGATGDYLRVNGVIRDFISRNRFNVEIDSGFDEKLRQRVRSFLSDRHDDKDLDISEYMITVKEALASDADVPDRLLVPSYFLHTITNLYRKGGGANYRDVVRLADRLLSNEKYLHERVIQNVCFLKCQALARLRDPDFFGAVRKLDEPERSFLHGFYFRNVGKFDRAILSYQQVLQYKPRDKRAKSELVFIYMQDDQHDLAYDLAKEVYQSDSNNLIHCNNYLKCILHQDRNKIDIQLVEQIVNTLKSHPSERAQEMYQTSRANVLARFENNYDEAFRVIKDTIATFPDVIYPVLTYAELATQTKDADELAQAINLMNEQTYNLKGSQHFGAYIRFKAIQLVLSGDPDGATKMVNSNSSYFLRKDGIESFLEKLSTYAK